MIEVSAAIIFDENAKILICKRKNTGHCGGMWEFPGGKKEQNETSVECLVRECKEELGADIEIIEEFDEFLYSYPQKDIHFHFYLSRLTDKNCVLLMNSHDELQWVRISDLNGYDFCPADKMLIAKLKNDFTQ